ncbi:MAG: hypothetical protein RRA94_08705 [Bacteroidota bacterium]|nr:hypothetical protein [Bacteroidota bacterium]
MARTGISLAFVFLLKLSFVSPGLLQAQWMYNPTLNTPVVAGADVHWPTLRTTEDAAYFFWKMRDPVSGGISLMGQKLDRDGYRQWPWQGKKFGDMGSGNFTNYNFNAIALDSCILLAWQHDILFRDTVTVYAQCIDGNGTPMWPQPRIIRRQLLPLTGSSASALKMQPRNENEAWLAWLTDDYAIGYCSVGTDGSVAHCGTADTLAPDPYSYTFFRTFPDGRGGLYVLSLLQRKPGEPPYTEIRLRQVDSTGSCTAIGGQRLLTRNAHMLDMDAVCQRDSTIIIAWWEGLDGHCGHLQWTRLRHQRFTPSGQPLYANGGRTLFDSAYHPVRIDLCAAADSGVFACFGELYNGTSAENRMYMQHIANDGSLPWGPDGRLLSSSYISGHVLALFPADDGGIIASWQEDPRTGTRGTDIYTQRIDADGTVRWQSGGVPVSLVPWAQYHLSLAALGDSLVLCWNDKRQDSLGVYAALIDPDGGRIPVTLLSFDAVRTAEGSLLRWTAEGEEDAYAYRVQRTSGENAGEWTEIGTVASTGKHGRQKHRFVDASPPAGTLRYRLACLHHDGSTVYSPVVTLHPDAAALDPWLDLYPQPARSHATISLQSAQPGTLSVYDAMGREQRRFSYSAGATALHWDLTARNGRRVAPGIYYLRTNGAEPHTRAFIIR